MQINKHGTFYIRRGWPTKIIDSIIEDNRIFSPNNELNAVDEIGVGRVMIKSMRYWSTAIGISNEYKDQQGVYHQLTQLGNIIANKDRYCMDKGTLWLLHRNLAENFEQATAWSWAFNICEDQIYTKEKFSNDLYAYLSVHGAKFSKKTVEREFDCFKNTYVSEEEFSLSKIIAEDTIPFFAQLKLLEYKGGGVYERRKISAKEIPIDIFFVCILLDNNNFLKSNRQIGIDQLMEEDNQVCKYTNINYSSLIEVLQRLNNEGYLHLTNNFGNRYIEIENTDVSSVLNSHYKSIGR